MQHRNVRNVSNAPAGPEESLAALDELRRSGRLRQALVLAQCDDTFQLIGFGLDSEAVGLLLVRARRALGEHIREALGAGGDAGAGDESAPGGPGDALLHIPPAHLRAAAAGVLKGEPVDTMAAAWATFEDGLLLTLAKPARRALRAAYYTGIGHMLLRLRETPRTALPAKLAALSRELEGDSYA